MAAEYVHQIDALEYLKTLPDASVDAVITDPPYFRVKGAAWDRQWADRATFLQWVGGLAAEWRRVLVPNGSLYCFASPQLAARVEVAVEDAGFVILNSIVWAKEYPHHSTVGKHLPALAGRDNLRSFYPNTERVVFAQPLKQFHNSPTAERAYQNAQDALRAQVFAPLIGYMVGEFKRAGVTKDQVREAVGCAAGSGLPGHWFTDKQWALPTEANYEKLRELFNQHGDDYLRRDYEDLRRDYEDLRRDYEDLRVEFENLRRPFTTPRDFGEVFRFPAVRAGGATRHICQKPLPLLRHIIETSTRPDALILDSFAGSGSTGVAAVQLGRRFVGTELDPEWAQRAEAAIRAAADPAQPPLF